MSDFLSDFGIDSTSIRKRKKKDKHKKDKKIKKPKFIQFRINQEETDTHDIYFVRYDTPKNKNIIKKFITLIRMYMPDLINIEEFDCDITTFKISHVNVIKRFVDTQQQIYSSCLVNENDLTGVFNKRIEKRNKKSDPEYDAKDDFNEENGDYDEWHRKKIKQENQETFQEWLHRKLMNRKFIGKM